MWQYLGKGTKYVKRKSPQKYFCGVRALMYSSPTTDKNIFGGIFFLFAHWYLLPFSYTDTKFEWLKPLLKVPAPRLNTATFYSLFWPSVRAGFSDDEDFCHTVTREGNTFWKSIIFVHWFKRFLLLFIVFSCSKTGNKLADTLKTNIFLNT